jgi:hypothetical protein
MGWQGVNVITRRPLETCAAYSKAPNFAKAENEATKNMVLRDESSTFGSRALAK